MIHNLKWRTLCSLYSLELIIYCSTHLAEEYEVPFKVDLVSEAKCHESVLDAGVPRYRTSR